MNSEPDLKQVDESTVASNKADVTEEEQQPQFDLTISTDNMAAYLKIIPAYSGQAVSFDQVMTFLTQRGITYGICEDGIRSFCEEGKFYSELLCAKGVYPVHGTDGTMEYKFNTSTDFKPKVREDGTVDFRDLELVKNVAKGEILCQITPPEPGKDGIDVYNHVVPFTPGFSPVLPAGTNTIISEDGLSLLADVDGCIEFKKTVINVSEVFIIHGDVDSASGNINAIGSVIVQGDVREGFSVKAGKDISIRGIAEGAWIEAKGTISISNGMNGMGKGTLKAGGNIVGKYFENAILISENDIYADVLMNCKATAQGSIILKGRKASLIGGSYEAAQKIVAKYIGTSSYTTTNVSITSLKLNAMLTADKEESSEELEQKLLNAQTALDDFQKKFANLVAQSPLGEQRGTGRDSLLIKAAIIKKAQLTQAVEVIKTKINKLSETRNNLSDYKIIGSSIVYSGTKMTIGPFSMNINNDYSNTKFYASPEEIVFAPVLPSDMA